MTLSCKVLALVFVLVASRQQHAVDADNPGGCQLFLEGGEPIDPDLWIYDATVPTAVKDTAAVGEVVYTYGCQGVTSITKGEATQPSKGVDYVTYELNAAKTQLTVVVTSAFLDYEKNETAPGLTLNTPVSFQCTSGPSEMKFRVNVELSNNNLPVFASDTEDVKALAMPFPNGQRVTTVTLTDVDIGNVGVTLTMDAVSQESFVFGPVKVTGKVYEFELKTTKQIYLETLTQVTVTAMDNSQGTSNSVVATLNFEPDLALSTPPTPRFTDALYLGTLDEEPPVGVDIPLGSPITFAEGYDAAETTVTVASAENADPGLFEVVMVGNTASIRLTGALPTDVLSKAFLILVLQAERTNAANTGRTVVHFTLPAGGITTTTTQATTTTGVTDCPFDCSQCPTEGTTTCATSSTETTTPTGTTGPTTPPVDEGSLTFEEAEYEADIEASTIGFVLRVKAIDDRNREITYTIETTSTVISNRVSVDASGSVNVNKLPPGTYAFTVAATVQGTSLYAFTKVTIRVQSVTLCGDVPQFEYALSVISVVENVAQEVIPGMTAVPGTDCVYSLDSEDFFSIDSATGALTSESVDRESELFADMHTPQVTVHLHVECAEHGDRRRPPSHDARTTQRRRRDSDDIDYSEIESVASDKQSMTVVAIIEDANDNAPVFEGTSPLVVGYPSEELAAQINPSALVTVTATDKDSGLNAEIAYSLSSDSDDGRFFVHPTSGTVYVLASESTYSDQQVSVVATDRAGQGQPCVRNLDIQVRILSRSQVTEVLMKGALLEEVEAVVKAMSAQTKFTVTALSASVVPSPATRSAPPSTARARLERFLAFRSWTDVREDDDSSQTLLRMVVYAVNGLEVVPSDEFTAQMAEFDSWTVQEIRQLAPVGDSTNGGLLAAVIALGVVVVLMLVAAGVVFFVFYVRPRMSQNEHLQDLINSGYVDSSSDGSSTAETKDVEADGKANVTSWLHMAGDAKDTDSGAKNYSSDFEDLQKSPPDVKVDMEDSSRVLSQFIMPEHTEAPRAFAADSDEVKGVKDEGKDEDEFGTKKKGRKKSVVTFNESVDCIEIEKM